jgi:epoxide hydrolase-like predicted phosphatase
MTSPIRDTVNAWLAAEGIDEASYKTVMREWVRGAYAGGLGDNPIHALERGECTNDEFEAALAAQLTLIGGGPVSGTDLLSRMFAGSVMDEDMLGMFRRLHGRGVPTGLLSNSWGSGSGYPRDQFPDLFDAVVISSEVGMRKPEARIFEHAAELLGLRPEQCIFIDDIQANIDAAEQVGYTGVLHEETAATVQRVADLLAVDLG